MQIIPLAAESLGTRATCLLVQTEDQIIIHDPSVSLGPIRYGLPPHLQEISSAFLSRLFILKAVKFASLIIQSHYHGDHFTLAVKRHFEFTNRTVADKVYNYAKIILAKDMTKDINFNQKKRAAQLWKRKNLQIKSADNKKFQFGQTNLLFSPPLPHGHVKGSWVISVNITDSKSNIIITSDVNGPSSDSALDFIINNEADLVILDGPSTYLSSQSDKKNEETFERITKIVDTKREVIIDHHLLRDINWKDKLRENGLIQRTKTLAEHANLESQCFESLRRDLYELDPLPLDFHKNFYLNQSHIMEMIEEYSKQLMLNKLSYDIESIEKNYHQNKSY